MMLLAGEVTPAPVLAVSTDDESENVARSSSDSEPEVVAKLMNRPGVLALALLATEPEPFAAPGGGEVSSKPPVREPDAENLRLRL